jgi:hypothetical protein
MNNKTIKNEKKKSLMLPRRELYHCLSIGSHFYAWAGIDHEPPIYTSYTVGMMDTYQHTQLFIGGTRSHEVFVWADLKLQYFWFVLLK